MSLPIMPLERIAREKTMHENIQHEKEGSRVARYAPRMGQSQYL